MARVDLLPAVRVERLLLGQLEPLDGLRHQPVELRGTDLPRHRGDLGIHPPGRLRGQGRGGVDGGLRHQPGPPRRHPPGLDLAPTTGAAGGAARGRDPSAASPTSSTPPAPHRARRHRTPPPPDTPHPRWAPRAHTHATVNDGGGVDRLRRVQVGPPGGEVEEVGRGPVLGGLALASEASSPEAARSSDLCSGSGAVSVMVSILPEPTDSLTARRSQRTIKTGFRTVARSSTAVQPISASRADAPRPRPSPAAPRSRSAGRARWRC